MKQTITYYTTLIPALIKVERIERLPKGVRGNLGRERIEALAGDKMKGTPTASYFLHLIICLKLYNINFMKLITSKFD